MAGFIASIATIMDTKSARAGRLPVSPDAGTGHRFAKSATRSASSGAAAWVEPGSSFGARTASAVAARSGATGAQQSGYRINSNVEGRAGTHRLTPDTPAAGHPPQRSQPMPEVLTTATKEWIAALPAYQRPHAVARSFPRIANRLSGLWPRPELCSAYLSDLLLDTRDGEREGFPGRVAAELAALFSDIQSMQCLPSAERGAWSAVKNAKR